MTTRFSAKPTKRSLSAAIPLPAAKNAPKPIDEAQPAALDPRHAPREAHTRAAGVALDPGQRSPETQTGNAGVALRDDHSIRDAHGAGVVSDLPANQAGPETQLLSVGDQLDGRQRGVETHTSIASVELAGRHPLPETQTARASRELMFCAEFLDDCERLRIATENRVRSMLADTDIDVGIYKDQVAKLAAFEHLATLALQRVLRRHPLGPWVRGTIGLGEKQAARLISSIGVVSWNTLEERPRRGPAELWAYCGYVPGQRRKKGVRANWSATAKMRAHLCAESCIKQRHSPYRAVYDLARVKHADAVHDGPCAQCGTKRKNGMPGRPAEAGSPLSDGHKHARALREVAKRILRDMFVEARRVGA